MRLGAHRVSRLFRLLYLCREHICQPNKDTTMLLLTLIDLNLPPGRLVIICLLFPLPHSNSRLFYFPNFTCLSHQSFTFFLGCGCSCLDLLAKTHRGLPLMTALSELEGSPLVDVVVALGPEGCGDAVLRRLRSGGTLVTGVAEPHPPTRGDVQVFPSRSDTTNIFYLWFVPSGPTRPPDCGWVSGCYLPSGRLSTPW